MSVPVLRTPRLTLRGIESSDLDALVAVFAHPAMSEFLASDFTDPAQVAEMVAARVGSVDPPGMGHWVFEYRGVVAGVGHLRPSKGLPGGLPEIAYYFDRAHAGQRLGAEAAGALVRYGFRALGLRSIWALIHESNVASRNLARRLGFLDVGCEIHYGQPHRVTVAFPVPHGHPSPTGR